MVDSHEWMNMEDWHGRDGTHEPIVMIKLVHVEGAKSYAYCEWWPCGSHQRIVIIKNDDLCR